MRTPSLENMRQIQQKTLGTLIIYALVRQDLQRLQMAVSTATLEAAVADVNDYGGGDGLDKYLAEESLDPPSGVPCCSTIFPCLPLRKGFLPQAYVFRCRSCATIIRRTKKILKNA